jgi:hypothetical protein
LMLAASNGHPAIVEKLIVARADSDLNTKNSLGGCALPLGPSGVVVGRRLLTIAPAPSGRFTALHCAASEGYTESAVALLVGGADQTITNYAG